MKKSRSSAICVALVALPFVVYGRALLSGQTFWLSDTIGYFYSMRSMMHEMGEAGRLFFWNPWIFSGVPLVSNVQEGMFYPLNVTAYVLPRPLEGALYNVLHLSLAGVFSYFWLRAAGMRTAQAAVGALFMDLNAYIIVNFPRTNIVGTCVWLPLQLYAYEKYLRDHHGKWIALGSLGVAMQLLAGSPQTALYDMTFFVFYAICRLFWRSGLDDPVTWRQRIRALLCGVALPVGIGTLMGAIQLLPFLEQARFNPRQHLRAPEFSVFLAPSIPQVADDWFFLEKHPNRDASEIDEGDVEPWLPLLPVLLAIGGAALKSSRREKCIGVLALLFAAFALGDRGPTGNLFGYLPVFRMLRLPMRWLYPVNICIALLAGCCLGGLLEKRGRTRMLGFVLLTAMLAELVYGAVTQTRIRPPTGLEVQPAAFQEMASKGGRMITMPGAAFHYADAGARWHVSNVGGNDASPFIAYFTYLHYNDFHALPTAADIKLAIEYGYNLPVIDRTSNMMKLLDLKWMVVRNADGRLEAIPTGNDLPHAFLVPQVRELALGDQLQVLGDDPTFNPRQEILLDKVPEGMTAGASPGTAAGPSPATPGEVNQVDGLWPDTLDFEANVSRPAVLFVSEMYDSGWTAEVDGAPARILRANVIFRAIALSAGKHRIHFQYQPSSLRRGAWLTLLGIVFAILASLWRTRKSTAAQAETARPAATA